MSNNKLPQVWDKVMQPVTFENFDFDTLWMADDSLWAPDEHNPFPEIGGHEGDGNAQAATDDSGVVVNRPYLCTQCLATYRRLGDLTRHQKEKHSAASSKYLCHIELCPRGIAGEGFGRMHHLVAHPKSNKHGMDAKEAVYMARQHNLPRSKVTGNGGLGVEEAL